MGLYLCIFEDDIDIDGVEVGPYEEFGRFRDAVVKELEEGRAGSKFPTLMLHTDCDGEWSSSEAAELEKELELISEEFRSLPANYPLSEWQNQIAKLRRLKFNSLYDGFVDVDGDFLLDRMIKLAKLSQAKNLPIILQ